MDYKEKLEEAKRLYESANDTQKYVLETLFPELKESEDERIKHEIKVILANTDLSRFALDYTFADMISWLKKQGDTNETINKDEFAQGVLKGAAINLITWIDYNAAEGNMCLSNMECKDVEDALVSGDWNKIYAYIKKKLEKQYECNPYSGTSFKYNGHIWGMYARDGGVEILVDGEIKEKVFLDNKPQDKYAQEATKEEKVDNQNCVKFADDVKPKFKVKYAGGEYNVFEIKDIAGVTYYGIEDEPNHIDYVQAENCERVGSYSIKENGCSFPTKPIMFSEQKSADSYCQENCKGFQETGKCFADGECKAKREAESNNKVKPKFKVGDWIVNNISKDVFLIKSINDGYYTLEDIKGNIISPCLPPCESETHLWAIQDAKDGDVLVSRSPFIYGKQCPYGGLNWCNNKFIKASNFIFTDSPVHPATKEQRDTLFAKMKEAGYTFDFEKKELKKIEKQGEQEFIISDALIQQRVDILDDIDVKHTSADNVKPKIENEIEIPFGAKDSELQEATYYIPKSFYAEIDDDKVVIKKCEKPAAWSKKDEKMFEYALNMIEWYSGKNEDKSRFVSDWLKSLKQRIGG